MQELKDEVKGLKDIHNSEPEKYKKRLKYNALTFCTKCQMFFEQTAGLAWLAEEINDLPDYERKSYICCGMAILAKYLQVISKHIFLKSYLIN